MLMNVFFKSGFNYPIEAIAYGFDWVVLYFINASPICNVDA